MMIDRARLSRGDDDAVRSIADLGAADYNTLRRCTPKRHGRGARNIIGDEVLGHQSVDRHRFQFCPTCVQRDLADYPGRTSARPWLRLHWTINHFRSCDKHGILLTPTKPERSRFEGFDFCRTIERYSSELEALVQDAVEVAPSPYQHWLSRRLSGLMDAGWLDRLPLHVGAEWCEALGVSALHPSRTRISDLSPVQWAQAADQGYRIASEGESSITALLQTLNAGETKTTGVWGPRDALGHAYVHLENKVKDPAYLLVRNLVRDFVVSNIPVEPGTRVLGKTIHSPPMVTIRSIAKAVGVHDNTARRLFERKGLGIHGIAKGLTNHRVVVQASKIDETFVRLKGSLFSSETKAKYQIPRTHLTALITIGELPTLRVSNGGPSTKHRFVPADLDAMMTRLFCGAEEVATPAPRQLPIRQARAAACIPLDQLLRLIFHGKLAWKGRLAGRSDYSALLVDADEVIALVRVEPARQGMTKVEAAKYIAGLNAEAVARLIAIGAIETTQEFSPQARRVIPVVTKAVADRFVEQYVTLGEFCRIRSINAKRGEAILRKAGAETAFDPNQVLAYIYPRSAVLKLSQQD